MKILFKDFSNSRGGFRSRFEPEFSGDGANALFRSRLRPDFGPEGKRMKFPPGKGHGSPFFFL
jgi:hypothetical protein